MKLVRSSLEVVKKASGSSDRSLCTYVYTHERERAEENGERWGKAREPENGAVLTWIMEGAP